MGARSSELSSKLRWEATVRMHVLRTYGRDKCAGEIVHVVAAGSAPFVGVAYRSSLSLADPKLNSNAVHPHWVGT
jgi:hypothetical protein